MDISYANYFPSVFCCYLGTLVPRNGVRQLQFFGAVLLHAGANDIRLRQTEVLNDYRSLIETVRSTSPEATIIVSGPLPSYRQGQERRDLGCIVLMAFTPAESERLFCWTSPRRFTPNDYDACGDTTRRLWRDDLMPGCCELLDRRSALETLRADAHKPVVGYSLTDFVYSMRFYAQEDSIISGFIHSGTDTTPWTIITQRKTRARTRARTSPPPLPVFEISTWNLLPSSRVGTRRHRDHRHVHGPSCPCYGKVRTHCFPGAHVLDVAAQVPEILNGDERVGAVVLNDYRSLIETVRNTSPEASIIVSGPLHTYRQGLESDACGETILPVSCWIGGQRFKHHTPMLKSVEDVVISGFIHSGTDTTPWITQRKTRARTRARTSLPPLPVFEISTWDRFTSRNVTTP
ncbi:hypothetical protein F2P79_022538 [Pimephales promelas]|nr:hypothetical protein F2P79_022538 [Pimephales promelas]